MFLILKRPSGLCSLCIGSPCNNNRINRCAICYYIQVDRSEARRYLLYFHIVNTQIVVVGRTTLILEGNITASRSVLKEYFFFQRQRGNLRTRQHSNKRRNIARISHITGNQGTIVSRCTLIAILEGELQIRDVFFKRWQDCVKRRCTAGFEEQAISRNCICGR